MCYNIKCKEVKRTLQNIKIKEKKNETSEINAQLKFVNCNDLIQQAKDIDKEDYSEDCFGISFNYVYDDDKLYILNIPDHIYYIDNNGNKNYLEVNHLIINNLEKVIMAEFKKFLKDKEKYIKENNVIYDIL